MKTAIQYVSFISALAVILLFPYTLSGQDPVQSDVFIWETEIEGCTIYVAGIVHVGKEDLFPPDEMYLEKLNSTGKVIFEIAEDFETIRNIKSDYIQKDRLPEDKYFRHTLDPKVKEKLIEILGEDKFYEYDQYNAWVLIFQLSVDKMRLMDYEPMLGVDKYLRKQAVAAGKEIGGLEDIEDQLRLVEFDLPYDIQIKIIEQNVANLQAAAEQEAVLCDAYYNNLVAKFEEVFISRFDLENREIKAVYDKLFVNRNKKWANQLEDLASKYNGPIFVGVGAGHFFGPGNLLECLKEKGFVIKPLRI